MSDEETTKETPALRSVPLLSKPPTLHTPSASVPLGKLPTFAKPLGLGPLGRSLPGKPILPSAPAVEVKEWCGRTRFPTVGWNVTSDCLELVPTGFPLERTHREIYEDAPTVSKRISEVLQAASVETEFDVEQAKAKCTTSDCVNFRIRLFAGSLSGEPVIVEVQRRSGSARSFMLSCRTILDAAEGKSPATVESALTNRPMPPIGSMKCLQSIKKDVSVDETDKAIAKSVEMLKSDKYDAIILGIQNLVLLTDVLKTSFLTASTVSKCVVLAIADKHNLRNEICSLLRNRTDDVAAGLEDDGDSSKVNDELRHHSLSVFANALELCNKSECLSDAVSSQSWFTEFLLPLLLEELKRTDICTTNAYHSVCCIRSLTACSELARAFVESCGAVDLLKDVMLFGEERHELLANASGQCLQNLQAV